MSGLFFFEPVESQTTSRIAVDPSAPGVLSPALSSDSPFDFGVDQWRSITRMVRQIEALNHGNVPDAGQWNQAFAAVRGPKTRIPLFVAAYLDFARQVDGFSSSIFPGVLQMAHGVAEYGIATVPDLYGKLQALLASLESRPPTPGDRAAFNSLVTGCLGRARQYQMQAQSFGVSLATFATAASHFRAATDQTPQSVKVQILPDIGGGVALGVSDDHTLAIGRTTNANDPLQHWDILYDDTANAFRICIALPGVVRALAQQSEMFHVFPGINFFRQPQLQMLPLIENGALVTDGVLWSLDVDASSQKILLMKDQAYCMDISGNDGWGQGTPVLSFRTNDGNNQHWNFQPKPYYPTDTTFLRFVSPAAQANTDLTITTLQQLEGAWVAICSDLENASDEIGRRIDIGKPFVSGVAIDAIIRAWGGIAKDAMNLIANAGSLG